MSNQNIWVFFELSDGRPKRVCLEMMQKAKALAEGSSGKAAAVIIDPEPEEASKAAFENGADQVLIVRQKFFFESAAYILRRRKDVIWRLLQARVFIAESQVNVLMLLSREAAFSGSVRLMMAD